jgi:hypothetical protein
MATVGNRNTFRDRFFDNFIAYQWFRNYKNETNSNIVDERKE